jgi:hypothetical protein
VLKASAKTIAALLAAAAGIILALNGADVIVASQRLVLACVITSSTLAALATVGAAWSEWRDRRLGAKRELADIQLTAAAWAIVDQVGAPLDYRDLGLAVYRTERIWWWPFGRRLRRLHRVRSSRRPTTSDVRWRPGKGVIGACVQRGEVVAVDLTQMYRDLGDRTKEEWPRVPDDVRLGLTFEEYLDVRDKYEVVVASPVIDDSGPRSKVLGCVALDGPEGRFASLTTDEVLGLLNSAAQGLLHQVG